MKKLLSLILVLALLLGTAALADEQLKLMDVEQLPGTQDVRLYINAVEPPTEDNLTVNMNGAPLRSPLTVQTASDTGRGTVYVFCMDVSGTIAKADIDRACQELVDFCNKLGPSDLMRVYIIGSEATPMCDYTADPAVIESALAGIPRRTSYTYLWKGIQMAADDLVANRDRLPELAQIIVFSDGVDDSDHSVTVEDSLDSVLRAGMPLRVVEMKSSERNPDRSQLEWFCEKSGGVIFDGKSDFSAALAELSDTLDDDYCVTAQVPYDQLQGEPEWFVQQRLGNSMASSNIMRGELSQAGVPSPSPAPTPVPVTGMAMTVNGEPAGEDVLVVPEGSIHVQWSAEGDILGYSVVMLDSADNAVVERDLGLATELELRTTRMNRGEVYTLRVGAKPADGGEDVLASARFMLLAPTPVPVTGIEMTVNGVRATEGAVMIVPEGSIDVQWSAEGDIDSYYVVMKDGAGNDVVERDLGKTTAVSINTARMNRGEVYALQVGAKPAGGGEDVVASVNLLLPAPTPTPTPLPVTRVQITLNGEPAGDDPVMVVGDRLDVAWSVDGEAKQYSLGVADDSGSPLMQLDLGGATEYSVPTGRFEPNNIYTLTLTAVPANGGEPAVETATFRLPTPVSQLNIAFDGGYDGDPVLLSDSGATMRWSAEGDVESYLVVVRDSAGNVQFNQDVGLATQYAISTASMEAGEVYEVLLGAKPVGGTDDDAVWASDRVRRIAPITAVSVAVNGEPAGGDVIALPEGAAQLSWTVDGDAQGYRVRVCDADGSVLREEERDEAQMSIAGLQQSKAYRIAVGAVPLDGTADDAVWSDGIDIMYTAPIDALDVSIAGEPAQAGSTVVLSEGDVTVQWSADGDADAYYLSVSDAEGTELFSENMGDATEYTFNTSGMALGERYGMRVGAKPVGCPESDAVWTEIGIMLPAPTPTPSPVPTPVPLSGEGWTRNGQPLDAERAFEVREERVQLGVQVEGEVESVDFTLTDSTGKAVSGVLETDEPDVENGSYPVTINRRAMVRGQVYTINADIAARNPETGDKALTLDITAPKSWTWLWIVCGIALLLIAGLVVGLILWKKKKEQDETEVRPKSKEDEDSYEKTVFGHDPGPVDPVAPTRSRLTYRQEMDDEPPTQQIQVVPGSAVIGRDKDCSIYFNGETRAERTVSHKHARLIVDQEGGMCIEPFPGTRNPTIVDGKAIEEPTRLYPGTVIKMGDITWTVISVEKVHKN